MGSESSDFWKIVWYILYTIFINNPTLKKKRKLFSLNRFKSFLKNKSNNNINEMKNKFLYES